jgi:hypothetical protein
LLRDDYLTHTLIASYHDLAGWGVRGRSPGRLDVFCSNFFLLFNVVLSRRPLMASVSI